MTNELSDEYLTMWRAFIEAHSSIMRNLEQAMEDEHGVALTWFDVLVHLEEAPDNRLRLGELAESVILTRSGITHLVDRMVEAGLIRREPCPGDRRGYFGVLTQEGKDTLERVGPSHSQKAREVFLRHVKPEEVSVMRGCSPGCSRRKGVKNSATGLNSDHC